MIFAILFVFSLLLVMDVDSLNRGFDVIVPLYLVGCVIIIFMYHSQQKNVVEKELETYVLKKKSKVSVIPPGDWKAKFFGRWEKITRTGFGEFLQFMGAPSMMIYMAKDAHFGQEVIDCDGDGTKIQINAFGVPAVEGSQCVLGTSEESAVASPGKDNNKRPFMVKMWWDEATKALRCKAEYTEMDLCMDQTRTIDENDVLHFTNTGSKKEGSSSSYTATMKRTSK